jgi:signal peptidase I
VEELPAGTPPETVETPRKSKALHMLFEIAETAVIALVLFFGINFLTARVRVDGSSMEPSLHDGELLIVSRLAYKASLPETADIIVFHLPQDLGQDYIKRVIGLPGDTVEILSRQVYVNEQLLDEPYIAARTISPGSWIVPEGQLFVMGDNRNNSSDSRAWGMVPLEDVVGKALVIYWPPENWGIIAHAESLAH